MGGLGELGGLGLGGEGLGGVGGRDGEGSGEGGMTSQPASYGVGFSKQISLGPLHSKVVHPPNFFESGQTQLHGFIA